MTVAAARMLLGRLRLLRRHRRALGGGNLARLTHAPNIVLIYESGTIGTRPEVLPLSIGDGELAETATAWCRCRRSSATGCRRGRIDVGFLGAAQIDRFGNLNSTVIGAYAKPKTRLPGAGGAPEIAAHARETFVILKQSAAQLRAQARLRSSARLIDGRGARARAGAPGAGPRAVITDLGILKPAADTEELHPGRSVYRGVAVEEARAAIGWPLQVAAHARDWSPPPTAVELRHCACWRPARTHAHAAHEPPGDPAPALKRLHARTRTSRPSCPDPRRAP